MVFGIITQYLLELDFIRVRKSLEKDKLHIKCSAVGIAAIGIASMLEIVYVADSRLCIILCHALSLLNCCFMKRCHKDFR